MTHYVILRDADSRPAVTFDGVTDVPPQTDRDLVMAAFSSMVGLSGILLALMGFILVRYDTLKVDTFTDPSRLTPYKRALVGLVGLMSLSALTACLALAWLVGLYAFRFPIWLVAAAVLAVPVLGAAVLKLRW